MLTRKRGFYEKYVKRLLDILFALLILIGFSWLYLLIAAVVRIRMGSPEDLPAAIEQLRKIVLAGWMQKEGVSDL